MFSKTCKKLTITVCILSIAKPNGFKLYPNPNNGSFTIVSSIEPIALTISDINGRILITDRLEGNTTHKVQYNQLANGMYIIEIIKRNVHTFKEKSSVESIFLGYKAKSRRLQKNGKQ